MEVFRRYTDLVEPLSIDEAFLDITGSMALFGPPDQIARSIKKEIRERTGLTASVGLAPNKFLAKIASDIRKPDGFMIVEAKRHRGVSCETSRYHAYGASDRRPSSGYTNWDSAPSATSPTATGNRIIRSLGSLGEHLYQLSHGHDDRPVVPNWEPKSISSETTFEEDTADRELLLRTILELSDHVAARLRNDGYRARKVTLKLRYSELLDAHKTAVD